MTFDGTTAGMQPVPPPPATPPPGPAPDPARPLGGLPALVTANGIAWLLLWPFAIAATGGSVSTATAKEQQAFYFGTVVFLGACTLVNALFSLAMGRALMRLGGRRPAQAFMAGGLLQFIALTTGALAFGRSDDWNDHSLVRYVGGLTATCAAYGFGHFMQSRAARHLAPRASAVHAVTGFVGLFWVPLLALELDLDDFGAAGIALGITQAVFGLAFPFVIGVVWLRYAAGLRRFEPQPAARLAAQP